MNKTKLIAALQQIKALAAESLDSLDSHSARQDAGKVRKVAKARSENSLSAHVLRLREEGFFKQARSAIEVHAKLQTHYSCDLNRVAVALLRLQRRKLLRKTMKDVGKKKQIAYVW